MTTIDPDIWTGDPADSDSDFDVEIETGTGAGSTTADADTLTDSGTAVSQAASNPVARLFRTLRERALGVAADDHGMSTVEYALGTVTRHCHATCSPDSFHPSPFRRNHDHHRPRHLDRQSRRHRLRH